MVAYNESIRQSEDELRVQHLVLDAINRTQSDDFDRFFDLFTLEATWMLPSQVTDVGLEEAKQFYRFTRNFRFEQQVTIDEVAFARLTFDGYLVPKVEPTSGSIRSVSQHLWMMRKGLSGGWLLDHVVWNTPKPAERPRRG